MKKNIVLFLLTLTAGVMVQAQLQPFSTGDRVAFVGNSITEAGYYESYVWLYYMLHFPGRRIIIYNRGIGGDRARNIYDRWDDDVVSANPTVVCLTFGMNDSGYFEFLAANADSTARNRVSETRHYFELLEKKLKAMPNARKILIASSPYDETMKIKNNYFPGKSKIMEEMVNFQQQGAKDNNWGWVDFFHPMTAIDLDQQKTDSTFTLTGSDRIHPGNPGHFVMAYLFLKSQGLDTLPVADVAIDASRLCADRTGNCTVTNVVAVGGGGVRFSYLARSLPYPMDTVPRMWGNPHRMSEAVGLIPYYSAFNREILRVSHLPTGDYQLTIDGRVIGQWSAGELDEGINLARLNNTPEYDQAMTVLALNEQRMQLESKLRAYYWLQFDYFRDKGMKYQDNGAAMDSVNAETPKNWAVASKRDNYREARYPQVRASWQKQIDLLVNEIYIINQPKSRRVEIRKVSK